MWCSACGSEYRSGFTRCPDCDVALIDERPPRAPEPRQPGDHDHLEYDLAGWSVAQRTAAEFWLQRMEIPAEWRPDGVLVVPSAREIQVDDLLDSLEVRDSEPVPPEIGAPILLPVDADARVLAGPGRRFAAFLIDYVVLTATAVLVYFVSGGRGTSYAASVVIDAVYFIGATAISGQTVGKLVLHTVVVRTDGVEPPGVRVAATRWAVGALAIPLGYIGVIGGLLSLGWTVAVYIPIFLPERRGLHDRAAHTDVLYRPKAR